MTALIFLGIVAFATLVAFGLAVAWVRRYPPAGVGLICLVLLTLWELRRPVPIVTLSGLNVYAADLVVLVLGVAGALEVTQLRANLGGWLVPWALFGICIAVSLLVGITAFGPGSAVNAARSLLYFFGAMTWALAVRPDRLRLDTVSLFIGWALVLLALYHGVRFGFGGPGTVISVEYFGVQNGRVLIAAQAMALLLCSATLLLGTTGSAKGRSQFSVFSSLVFGGVAVIAQHRSVWAAATLGVAAVWLWSPRRRARKKAFILLVLATWVGLIGWLSGALVGSDWFASVSSGDTYDWRTSSWQNLISQAIARGPFTVLFGDAFGSGAFLRQIPNGAWTTVSSHNWYVEIFVSLGVIGLVALFPMVVSALVKSRALPAIWTFLLAAVATYGWAYFVPWYLAPWLGAAITMSLQASRSASKSSSGLDPLGDPKSEFDALEETDTMQHGTRAKQVLKGGT